MDDRRTFDGKVFDTLKLTVKQLALEVPELEAVGIVCLWRFKDQTALPAKMLVGADGPIVNPDQLLRLEIQTLEFARSLNDYAANGVLALQNMASSLARTINEQGARTPPPEIPTETTPTNGPIPADEV